MITPAQSKLIDAAIMALVYGALLSIPALIFSSWWFSNPTLLLGLALPLIFFMAG
jgi:hypothetical protein